jgi:hypothetical protein
MNTSMSRQRGHELLDPHDGHQHVGQRRAHAAVALGLEHADRARLGHGEVGAADSHARRQELRPQVPARRLSQGGRLVGQVRQVQLAGEHIADL